MSDLAVNHLLRPVQADKCPLCGKPNDCQYCASDPYKGPCWCAKIEIPKSLLDKIPEDQKNKSCLCRTCIGKSIEARKQEFSPTPLPGEFYLENGLTVFTREYHLRRGYCCGSGCRHCPYTPR